ncbi:MAG: chemotaxis response regulator protein-glutamate methylesterase [Polyangiaceae bacterium]|jgi:two-component system chemotaxis response regulator CheB
MPKIRVLVVDDSVVVRRLISDALAADANCEVVGTAANGKIALAKISQVNPDIVTLDIEMPEMDGLTTLAEIRKTHPRLPVIMFSTISERAASATLQALTLGATDYVTKPSGGNIAASLERVREQLIPKVRWFGAAAGVAVAAPPRPGPSPTAGATKVRTAAAPHVEILAIGCSTGGPNALTSMLEGLSPTLAVPAVIVQHMPPVFTRLLAERLRAHTRLCVNEAKGGESLLPGEIWIAPGDYHMIVRREGTSRRIALVQSPHENSCRPAVDVLFRSVVECYGGHTLAVVLTGMGQDGLRGCEYVREAGGQVIVQDEATSVVWGMPGFVANAGLAEAVLPLGEVAGEILRRVGGRRRLSTEASGTPRSDSCP